MGGAPLVQNRSLPFIRPPPLSCHPNVKIGGALWRYSTVHVDIYIDIDINYRENVALKSQVRGSLMLTQLCISLC